MPHTITDADRYRWLRAAWLQGTESDAPSEMQRAIGYAETTAEMDTAIDAELRKPENAHLLGSRAGDGKTLGVEAQRELLNRLRHYGDNDRDAACALIEQLGADLYTAEGRADKLARDLESTRECVNGWVKFGSNVTEALGLRVMSPKAILAQIATLRAQRDALKAVVVEMLELSDNWPGIAYTAELHQRVSAALAAAPAAAPPAAGNERKPLTWAQFKKIVQELYGEPDDTSMDDASAHDIEGAMAVVRAVERAHGILTPATRSVKDRT